MYVFCFSIPQQCQAPLHTLPIAGHVLDMDDDNDDELEEEDESGVDTEVETDCVEERKSICFQKALLELASIRIPSHCQRKACDGVISVQCRYVGCAVQLKWVGIPYQNERLGLYINIVNIVPFRRNLVQDYSIIWLEQFSNGYTCTL